MTPTPNTKKLQPDAQGERLQPSSPNSTQTGRSLSRWRTRSRFFPAHFQTKPVYTREAWEGSGALGGFRCHKQRELYSSTPGIHSGSRASALVGRRRPCSIACVVQEHG
ncbi:unnamed protein product [Calypogeia fissa]